MTKHEKRLIEKKDDYGKSYYIIEDYETVNINDDGSSKEYKGTVYETKRVDYDGFIRDVKVVDVGYKVENGIVVPVRTIEISDATKRIIIKKDGSSVAFDFD